MFQTKDCYFLADFWESWKRKMNSRLSWRKRSRAFLCTSMGQILTLAEVHQGENQGPLQGTLGLLEVLVILSCLEMYYCKCYILMAQFWFSTDAYVERKKNLYQELDVLENETRYDMMQIISLCQEISSSDSSSRFKIKFCSMQRQPCTNSAWRASSHQEGMENSKK